MTCQRPCRGLVAGWGPHSQAGVYHLTFHFIELRILPALLPFCHISTYRIQDAETVLSSFDGTGNSLSERLETYFTQFLGGEKEMVTAERLACPCSLWVWSNRDSCPHSAHSLTPYLIGCPCTHLDAKAEHWTQPVVWFFFLHTIYLFYACEGCVFIPSLIQQLLSA